MLAQDALAAQRIGGSAHAVGCDPRFFTTHLANAGPCLTTTVIEGANAIAVDTETIG
jgi:hypothetical protein